MKSKSASVLNRVGKWLTQFPADATLISSRVKKVKCCYKKKQLLNVILRYLCTVVKD